MFTTIQDKSGLTKEKQNLCRWTILLRTINLKSYDDNTINGFNQPQEENLQPILRVETAVAAPKKGEVGQS